MTYPSTGERLPTRPPISKWNHAAEIFLAQKSWRVYCLVAAVAAVIYLGCIISPPSLMDDVDAVQAQIARNMLTSGDWVTARLDGVVYLEKAPLVYWIIAICYKIFGVYDWVARIPIALAVIALAVLTAAFGIWAFCSRIAGLYSGLVTATCVGLFLFTRILIPDVMLTLTIALAMWAFLRTLDEEERRPGWWAFVLAVSLGVGLLLKSLIAVVFPIGGALIYLAISRQLFVRRTWRRLRLIRGLCVILLVAAPWHILATLRNPPYLDFTFHSVRGQYHGFLWFYFMNEQVLRFLNLRYPRDYDTVPWPLFWLFHFLWLFPWSVYLPAVAKLSFKPADRAGRTRLLALCWTGFLLVFFTFSTTQEYYSMPCYPALALLAGSAMAKEGKWIKRGTLALALLAACAGLVCGAILIYVHNIPAPGDISRALMPHPAAYKLSLGHMEDLTLDSFAYLRLPLFIATVAFLAGAIGNMRSSGLRAYLASSLMMMLFLHAARVAMVTFDPYLSSRPLAEAIRRAPPGELITEGHYYPFSSVFFYLNRGGLLLNGLRQNLVYGAAAPEAPPVFLDDAGFVRLWDGPQRFYLVAAGKSVPRLTALVGRDRLNVVTATGGKFAFTNKPLP